MRTYAVLISAALFGLTAKASEAAVDTPACAALEAWALTVNAKDRWAPDPALPRLWFPRAFGGPDFEDLFGAPLLDWSLADAETVAAQAKRCAAAARRAKRHRASKGLVAAHGFVNGKLKGHIVRRAKADAAIETATAALTELPASDAALAALAALETIDITDGQARAAAGQAVKQRGGATVRPVRGLLQRGRRAPGAFNRVARPAIAARAAELRAAFLAETRQALAAHPDGGEGIAYLQTTMDAVRTRFGDALGAGAYAELDAEAARLRRKLAQGLEASVRRRIAAAPDAIAGLAEVDAALSEAEPWLPAAAIADLRTAGDERRREIAASAMAAAVADLRAAPATLAAARGVAGRVAAMVAALDGVVGADEISAFERGMFDRRAAMAADAVPEFEAEAAAAPATEAGLEHLTEMLGEVAGWEGVAPSARTAFEAAVAGRRTAIEQALAAEAAAQHRIRLANAARLAKRRISALRYDLRDLKRLPGILDRARRSGLEGDALAEIEDLAAARKVEISDGILAAAVPRLAEAPPTASATPQGFTRFSEVIDAFVEALRPSATPAALAAFEAEATSALTAIAVTLRPRFERRLAELPASAAGRAEADQAAGWAQGWSHVAPETQADFVAIATSRREAIDAAMQAAERDRLERAERAGAAAWLFERKFVDANGLSSLEFVNAERVVVSMAGFEFGGKYEVVGDRVFIEGGRGELVFQRQGERLTGMVGDFHPVDGP